MTQALTVAIQRLPGAEDLPLPKYATAQAAGMDLCAAVKTDVVLAPGARAIIPTGYAIALPVGTEAQVRPRSGLAAKNGITVLNSPGTIDADYRGEVGVILINVGGEASGGRGSRRSGRDSHKPWHRALHDHTRTTHRADGDCDIRHRNLEQNRDIA